MFFFMFVLESSNDNLAKGEVPVVVHLGSLSDGGTKFDNHSFLPLLSLPAAGAMVATLIAALHDCGVSRVWRLTLS